jgi:hypothetical protein
MNEILNIKINSNLSKIIGIYLLPNIDALELKDHLRELMNRTINIRDNLSSNEHYSDIYGKYVYGLLNTKIKKMSTLDTKIKNIGWHYWTIRNI